MLRDLVSVALSPGVLAGGAVGLYARRMARHIQGTAGTVGPDLHDAIMVPAVLSLLCAGAAAATARLAAIAFIPAWTRGGMLPPLHEHLEAMLFNIAAGLIVAVLSVWSGDTRRTMRQLGGMYLSWWALRVSLHFALPWMVPVAGAALGRTLTRELGPAVPSLVWMGIYCSVAAGVWMRTEGHAVKFTAPGVGPPAADAD